MKVFFKILGLLCVALGTAGVFLPVLPTTPFLLAAMFCFARSSAEYRSWLLRNRLLGPYVECYAQKGGPRMAVRVKVRTLVMMWSVMLLSAYFVDSWWIRGFLLIIGVAVTVHIVMIKAPR